MKKVLTALAPRRRELRPSKKTALVLSYLLAVTVLLLAVTWRGALPRPAGTGASGEKKAAAVESALPHARPEVPFNALDEEYVSEPVPLEADPALRPAPDVPLAWPLEGEILAGHHEVFAAGNVKRFHVGVDIAAGPEALVQAAWPGVVTDVRHDPLLGLLLEVSHGGGYTSYYANLSDVFFAVGEEVPAGVPVARVGQTAVLDAATGWYLHFALYKDGEALDPVQAISPR